MNDTNTNADEFGIRVTPPNLVYSTNDASRWFGSGIMDKPIGDFFHNDWGIPLQERSYVARSQNLSPYFARRNFGSDVSIYFYRGVIPEPAEYALVFGLFALAFVILKNAYERRNGRDLANSNPKTSPSLSEHRLNN